MLRNHMPIEGQFARRRRWLRGGASAAAAVSALVLAACGGGTVNDEATAQTQAQTADELDTRSVFASTAPVAALALVSALPNGGNATCGISANGEWVAYIESSTGRNQVLVRNVRSGTLVLGSAAANGSSLGESSCRALSPNGRFLVLELPALASNPFLGTLGRDAALFVKDLQTGDLRRATPQLATLPTTRAFQFVGLSNDGQRVAFLGLPTTTYSGAYDLRPDGPVRLLYRDLSSTQVVDLSSAVRLDPTTDPEPGVAALSGDGRLLAFVSSAAIPELGDNDGRSDVFLLNLSSGTLGLVSQDTNSTNGFRWNRIRGFAVGDSRLLYQGQSGQAGQSVGIYSNALDGSALRLLASSPIGTNRLFGGAIEETIGFDDALRSAVFLRYDEQARFNQPWLRNLSSGAEQRLDQTAAGVLGNSFSTSPLMSADGAQVAFASFSSNLVRLGRTTPRGQVYLKTVAPASAATQ
jgi:hypothetical protein